MQTRERVRDLIERGLSVREIAQLLSISTQAVYKHLKAMGITPPTRDQRRGNGGEAA